MKKIILIINMLMIISINLISYAADEQIEINTDISEIENGQEIEISIKIKDTPKNINPVFNPLKKDR